MKTMAEKEDAHVAATSTPTSSLEGDAAFSIDPVIEKRILRKLDFKLMPILCFLFLVSFFDRSNIGNAKIQGMDKTLHLTGNKYNIALMVFNVAYMVFGVPANIVFKLTGPKSLGTMMFIWGLFALGQGLTHTWGGLVACRFMMGVFEAGFVPGCAYLIGSYYRKDEFLRRYVFFFSAAIIAGAFNGLLCTLLGMANGAGGLESWRWIFLVEGIITCVVALFAIFFIFPFPEHNTSFTSEERATILARNKLDGGEVVHDRISKHVIEALFDWKVWLAMLTYIGAEENISSVVGFQPTVLKGLGYTATQAQVHSIPIYMVAWVASIVCGVLSERLNQRFAFAFFGALCTFVGLAIEIAHPKPAGTRYAGMFFLTAGCYITMPIIVVWGAINVGKGYKRTVAFGMIIATGNCGALISSNVFYTNQAPVYKTGFSIGMGMNVLSTVCMTALFVGLLMANKKKDRKYLNNRVTGDEELTGEKHPDFRYSL